MGVADRKLKRATKHIDELNEFLRHRRPFRYVLKTNTKTGERSTGAKENEAVIGEATDIVFDIIQNIRTSLDYAYFDIVSPFVNTTKGIANIQFPFAKTAAGLHESVSNRLAHYVSRGFIDALIALKPHGEAGGNSLLYTIHELAACDRHRFPTPTAHYTSATGDILRKQIPDFPYNFVDSIVLRGFAIDFLWHTPVQRIDSKTLGSVLVPTTHIFEHELSVPVDICFHITSSGKFQPLIPTLHGMVGGAMLDSG